jgi:PPOX class probable F420-dependent enzyme
METGETIAMIDIDTNTPFGQRVHDRLQQDRIVWLVTVDGAGTPQPSPVWFYWTGNDIVIYSQRNTPKLHNIARNARVAVHFDGDEYGNNIVIMTGTATVDESIPPANEIPAYLAKYLDGIESQGMTGESFAQEYSVPIRFTPEKLRGF